MKNRTATYVSMLWIVMLGLVVWKGLAIGLEEVKDCAKMALDSGRDRVEVRSVLLMEYIVAGGRDQR